MQREILPCAGGWTIGLLTSLSLTILCDDSVNGHRYLFYDKWHSVSEEWNTGKQPSSVPDYSPIKYLKAGIAPAPLTVILLNIGKEAP